MRTATLLNINSLIKLSGVTVCSSVDCRHLGIGQTLGISCSIQTIASKAKVLCFALEHCLY